MADKKTFTNRRRRKHSESRLKTNKLKLPIQFFEKDLVKAVENNDFLVVVGETGSGKTTQLPQFLHRAGFTGNGEVIGVTQPRRIAAISVASRVAEEIGCPLGAKVGYQVRFDDCTSRSTVIKYMTDGCLLREFLDDPKLGKYGVIILDEAHERSLDTDILFGLVKELFVIQNTGKCGYSPPKVIIMSATLNHRKFSEFLGKCPVFEIPGQCFPVKEIYCNYVGIKDLQTPNYITKAVETVMSIHLERSAGDVLLFLTGQEEIEQACDKLFERAEKIDYRHDVCCDEIEALLVLPLYGSMTTELQQRVFDPVEPWIRKVVVATNIAATSLTIDGIKYVVDSGFVKQLVFNPRTGLDSLNVVLISRSEAVQRAGRAGRTAPGKCYRLYSREVYETAMTEETVPEIQRTSLTRVVLHLKTMGIHNVLGFHYIDPPEKQMILEALRQLYYYEALDKDGNITPLGRKMIEYPLSPGLSRAVIYSAMLGCEGLVLPVAAMLSVESVLSSSGSKKQRLAASQVHRKLAEDAGGTNDFATLLYVYKQCHSSVSSARWCREHFIHWRALKMAASVCQQLQDILDRQKQRCHELQLKENDGDSGSSSRDLLRRVLCNGFFCNVARKSISGSSFRTMDGHGTTAYIHPSSTLFGCDDKLDWIIYHDIVWTSKIYMRTVCPVRYEWIKDLLPRLHDVDVFTLSGLTERQNEEGTPGENNNQKAGKGREGTPDSQKDAACQALKLSKRNTEDSVAAARERYLARKLARTQTQR